MINMPEYTDGKFQLFRITIEKIDDFSQEVLHDEKIEIWFQEVSVYDRVLFELEQGGIEVTMKIRIPRYKGINSKCICVIDGEQHQVYNAAHIINKDGFPETELTLKKPEHPYEIPKEGNSDKE